MKPRRIIVLTIAVLLVLQGLVLGAAADVGEPYVTGIQVQNQDEENDVEIQIQFYWATGTANEGQPALPEPFTATIDAGGANQYFVPDAFPELPDGFVGSAVVTGDGPIAAILNTATAGGGESLEDPFRRGAATGIGGGSGGLEPSKKVYAPYLRRNYYDFNSYIAVQNTADEPADITVTYKDLNGNEVDQEPVTGVPPHSTHIFDQGENDTLIGTGPEGGFGGSGIISSTQPVAVVVNAYDSVAGLESYNGFPSGDKTWYMPKIDLEYWGYNSGLSIQNVSDVTATMEITFTFDGVEYPSVPSPSIGPGQTWQIYMPDAAGDKLDYLPHDLTGTSGSAVVTSDQDVVATVVTLNEETRCDQIYSAVSSTSASGTSALLFPQFDKNYAAEVWNGGLQVQNIGDESTRLVAIFSGGNLTNDFVSTSDVIDPGDSASWFGPKVVEDGTGNHLPDGFSGAVTVVAESETAVAGIYTGRSDTVVGDSEVSYNGIQK